MRPTMTIPTLVNQTFTCRMVMVNENTGIETVDVVRIEAKNSISALDMAHEHAFNHNSTIKSLNWS